MVLNCRCDNSCDYIVIIVIADNYEKNITNVTVIMKDIATVILRLQLACKRNLELYWLSKERDRDGVTVSERTENN